MTISMICKSAFSQHLHSLRIRSKQLIFVRERAVARTVSSIAIVCMAMVVASAQMEQLHEKEDCKIVKTYAFLYAFQ